MGVVSNALFGFAVLGCVGAQFFDVFGGKPCGSSGSPSCPTCTSPSLTCAGRRVRRDIMKLSNEQRLAFFAAMDIMKKTDLAAGRAQYGKAFQTYDYFVQKHVQSATDPRNDQSHFGVRFMNWHKLFLLEFELAVLAVDSSIGALPYWDITGKDAQSLFGTGANTLGSLVGTGPSNGVVDGFFGHWRVAPFSVAIRNVTGYKGSYAGNARGELRDPGNNPNTTLITRYPKCSGPKTVAVDEDKCANLNASVSKWYECIMISNNMSNLGNEMHHSLHAEAHRWIGSGQKEIQFGCPGTRPTWPALMGDFNDINTSPNDPIFMLHHANLDRNHFHFMIKNKDKAPTYFDYPVSGMGAVNPHNPHGAPASVEGRLLLDVVSNHTPYIGSELGLSSGAPVGALKHADVLCWLAPQSAPYTYDSICPFQPATSSTTATPATPQSAVSATTSTASPNANSTASTNATSSGGSKDGTTTSTSKLVAQNNVLVISVGIFMFPSLFM